jgi:Zn-finger nucleic acid-binding protein
MKCPIDTTIDLVIADRQGIEIDYCPTCRGVWLDRGELDKIIERSAAAQSRRRDDDDDDDDDDRRRMSQSQSQPYPYKKKKRSSFLGEIFDF